MSGSKRKPSKPGSKNKPRAASGATKGEPRFKEIEAAAPDPGLLQGDEPGYQDEQREGQADKAIARSETPWWMRQLVGEVPREVRVGIFATVVMVALIIWLAWWSGPEAAKEVLKQVIDILKMVLGGIVGGHIVRRGLRKNR
jgi:hypothetical protein